MFPSLLPPGSCWRPEHPLDTRGSQDPAGKVVAANLVGSAPGGPGSLGQARTPEGSLALGETPCSSLVADQKSEDVVSRTDSSSLLGLKLVGD